MVRPARAWRVRPLGLCCALLVGLMLPLTVPAAAERDRAQPLFGPPGGDSLQIMTFNLRFAAESGPHSWPRRRPVLADLLRLEQPTVLGTQEGLYGQLRDIDQDLRNQYDWIGVGREGGSRDEFTAIFFDTRRVEPVEFEHFWLSDTPDVVGSNTWGNDSVRMATWVRFADRRTGTEFVVLNTHLDDQSRDSRMRSAELVRDRVRAFPPELPVIVTGDFNAPAERSAPYEALVTDGGLTDAWPAATDRRTSTYTTWHGYRPLEPDGPRIDWILTRGEVEVDAIGVNTFREGGQFPSDHLPVQALVRITSGAA
jgi:endonuclease/exonuclease/phosphatase family metal-dependent hydrolase